MGTKQDESNNEIQVIENFEAEIIQFPIKFKRPEILSELVAERDLKAKEIYATELTCRFLDQAIEACIGFGLNPEDPIFRRDFAYISNGITAIFFRYMGVSHPLHPILDSGKISIDENGIETYEWPHENSSTKAKKIAVKKKNIVANNSPPDVA